MSFGRVLRVSVAVLVAFGVQVAHGTPSRSTQTLRALRCCQTTCRHATGSGPASRCCGVAQSDTDAAAKTPGRGLQPPPPTSSVVLDASATPAGLAPVAAISTATGSPPGRAAPPFLATYALLI